MVRIPRQKRGEAGFLPLLSGWSLTLLFQPTVFPEEDVGAVNGVGRFKLTRCVLKSIPVLPLTERYGSVGLSPAPTPTIPMGLKEITGGVGIPVPAVILRCRKSNGLPK